MQRPSPRERVLLYSIWSVIALIALLYFFWPKNFSRPSASISVRVAPELRVWFQDQAQAVAVQAAVRVLFHYQNKSLEALRHVPIVQLGYDLGREREILFRGTQAWRPAESVPASVSSQVKETEILFPNPNGLNPQWIRVYFAGDH